MDARLVYRAEHVPPEKGSFNLGHRVRIASELLFGAVELTPRRKCFNENKVKVEGYKQRVEKSRGKKKELLK